MVTVALCLLGTLAAGAQGIGCHPIDFLTATDGAGTGQSPTRRGSHAPTVPAHTGPAEPMQVALSEASAPDLTAVPNVIAGTRA